MARLVIVLTPLVLLSQRALFLGNAWRLFVRRAFPQHTHALTLAGTPSKLAVAAAASMASPPLIDPQATTTPSRPNRPASAPFPSAPSRTLAPPSSPRPSSARISRQQQVGYFYAARADPKRPSSARTARASRMPLPPAPPTLPNQSPRKPPPLFLCRRPEGNFWDPLLASRPLYGASSCGLSTVEG